MLGWEFPPFCWGGLGKTCHGLVKGLIKNGIDIQIVLPYLKNAIGIKPSSIKNDFLDLYLEDLDLLKEKNNSKNNIYKNLYTNLSQKTIDYANYCEKIFEKQSFDLIHAHDWLTFNIDKTLSVKNILQKTTLKSILLINDFQAFGYGLQTLDEKSLFIIKKGNSNSNNKELTKAYLEAGTGLGKGFLIWNRDKKSYDAVASEEGHSDFPAQNPGELDLINFIRKEENEFTNIEWEDLISGKGISNIYKFVEKTSIIKK